jgi:predicted AlkP superfamily pyrophosphatase or phosphodiesterase
LWVTAEKAGVRTATMFWPGSDLPIHGRQPHDWKMYDKRVSADQRVDQVLSWLDRPASERPRFVTLYFDEVDSYGHNAGPDSQEVNAALARTDSAVGRLVEGLKARRLFAETDLIIVADHGMAATSADRVTYLEDLLPLADLHVVGLGAEAALGATRGHDDEVGRALLGPHPHMTCWRKQDVPRRFHYGSNPRVPPYVCLAETGWLIEGAKGWPVKKGAHGFDPYDPLMGALFVAHGPAFRKGAVLPAFDNVDVYPLLAALVGVDPLPNEGNLSDLESGLNP